MKRAKKNGKRAARKTLAERRILQNLQDWANGSYTPERVEQTPDVRVDSDDFSDDDLTLRVALLPERGKRVGSRPSKPRRVFFFFRVPARWRRLSSAAILWRMFIGRRNMATMISVAVHGVLALILLSIVLTVRVGTMGIATNGGFLPDSDELDFVDEGGDSLAEETTFEVVSDSREADSDLAAELLVEENNNRAVSEQLADMDGSQLPDDNLMTTATGSNAPGGGTPFFSENGSATGRSARKRGAQGRKGDVTKESEDAVERGLEWLARHQLPDGGWAFDLTAKDSSGHAGSCKCSNSTSTSGGTSYVRKLHPSRMAATAIAILPFLGSGYTHTESGPYQKTVASGLRYLEYHAITKEDGVDFRDGFADDGASYVQALAVLACCEAYEMTKDENLKPLAEGGLLFIENSQLRDGGWRYASVGDSMFHDTVDGDLSVSGWQMLALKSGISAGFAVPVSVAYRFGNFLDLVKDDAGRSYRYQPKTKEDVSKRWGTTAVGVLMREYLGEEPGDNPQKKNDLDRGADQITKWISLADSHWQDVRKEAQSGRVKNRKVVYVKDGRLIYNLYFAYYAALALRHYGGKNWEDSFPKLRDMLVGSQTRSAALSLDQCEDGSWLFYDPYMNDGGRLLNTSLAILILETPYRYLPMYR